MREAEEHEERTSLQVFVAERFAVLILEMKRPADGRDCGADRRRVTAGDVDDRRKHQNEAADKGAQHRQKAGSPYSSAQTILPNHEIRSTGERNISPLPYEQQGPRHPASRGSLAIRRPPRLPITSRC